MKPGQDLKVHQGQVRCRWADTLGPELSISRIRFRQVHPEKTGVSPCGSLAFPQVHPPPDFLLEEISPDNQSSRNQLFSFAAYINLKNYLIAIRL